jgi:hypothetical protein
MTAPHASSASLFPLARERAPLRLSLVCALMCAGGVASLGGCKEESPLTLQGAPLDAGVAEEAPKVVDASTRPEVAVQAPTIFQNLPYPPAQVLRKPGDPVGSLRDQEPLLQEVYSPRFLAVTYTDPPFQSVVYTLDPTLRVIESVVATFQSEYTHPELHTNLKEAIKDRLGAAESFDEGDFRGERWTNIDYRIDLRVDRRVKDLELLFHRQGAETLERTTRGLLKGAAK